MNETEEEYNDESMSMIVDNLINTSLTSCTTPTALTSSCSGLCNTATSIGTQYTTTPYISNGYYIDRDYAPSTPKFKELKLINGSTVIMKFVESGIKSITERDLKTFGFTKKFPFVKIEKCKYSVMWYDGRKFEVDCPASTLLHIFDIDDYTSFAQKCIENTLRTGEN